MKDEEKSEIEEMDEAVAETTHAKFGKEEHGIPEESWPKKFVVDGGLKYDFGGAAPEGGGEDAPGQTHAFDKSPGKIKDGLPKKFVVDGRGGFDTGGEEE